LFGVDPKQANLRKYITSEEKVSVREFIPELEDQNLLSAVRNSAGIQIKCDIELIRKVIGSEIETLEKNSKSENGSHHSPINYTAMSLSTFSAGEGGISPLADKKIKALLTYLDLQYGKHAADSEYEIYMKLVMIHSELLLEKEEAVSKDPVNDPSSQKLKMYFFLFIT
jgi:hypothetical protein